jgi:hypothetical protein
VTQRIFGVVAAAAAVVAVAGCGLAAPSAHGVTVTVTRNFGSEQLNRLSARGPSSGETLLGLLSRRVPVGLGPGGRPVESIGGVSGGAPNVNWSVYANGVLSYPRASLHAGDSVWWDLHDWTATRVIRAVVGAYPEPFVRGFGGKRYPTTLECASDVGAACKLVGAALDRARVPYASEYIGSGSGSDTLGVIVGTWRDVRSELVGGLLTTGPSNTGIYARFAADGTKLELLDQSGGVARSLSSGAGLVAATADSQSAPTWLIVGTDQAGVTAAARALNTAILHDRFAVAVVGGAYFPLPVG